MRKEKKSSSMMKLKQIEDTEEKLKTNSLSKAKQATDRRRKKTSSNDESFARISEKLKKTAKAKYVKLR